MKTCIHCHVPQPKSEYENSRKRICNTCKEDVQTNNKLKHPPKQKLTDEQMIAEWTKSNSVTVIPHTETVYEPAINLEATGAPHEYYDDGTRIYRSLNKAVHLSGGQDCNAHNYGHSSASSGGD